MKTLCLKVATLTVAIGLAITSPVQAGVGDGMIGFWSFNDNPPPALPTIADPFADKSGKGNNGIATEVDRWEMGVGMGGWWGWLDWWQAKRSLVANFNGASSVVVVNENPTLASSIALRLNSGSFTVAAWVNLGWQPTNGEHPIVTKPGWRLSEMTTTRTELYDYDGDGVEDHEDVDKDWMLDTEDLNYNGMLDPAEDKNNNSMLDTEDQNGNGWLDSGEDLNGNGLLDFEDVNYNGTLDLAEDKDGDNVIDTEDANGNGWMDEDYWYTWIEATAKFCSGTTCVEGGVPLSGGDEWHHLMVAYDSVKKMVTLYVDSSPTGTLTPFPSPAPTAGGLLVGKDGVANQFLAGQLDDVRIYNRVLTADEMRELAKGCKPAIYDPKTGKLSIPCVADATYYPPVIYKVEMQQAVSPGGDMLLPSLDDLSFGISTAIPPKLAIATPTNPEPAWGAGVVGYYVNDWYGNNVYQKGDDTIFLSGFLSFPMVAVLNPIAAPKTQCYGVRLDQVFYTNRFFLTQPWNVWYNGPDCEKAQIGPEQGQQGAQGIQGAASAGEGQQPARDYQIPKPTGVRSKENVTHFEDLFAN